MLYDARGNKIEKTNQVYSNEVGYGGYTYDSSKQALENKRGITIYDVSQIQGITGRDQEGRLLSWGVEEPYFYLTVQQRIEMFRLSTPVFGIVSSRMNRLSGLEFNITTEERKEEELAESMKDLKSIYSEIQESIEMKDLVTKGQIFKKLNSYLPELKTDLSNFNSSLIRWKRKIKFRNYNRCSEIKSWFQEPNNGVKWEEFVKKYVFDLLIHGAVAIYKDVEGGILKNFDLLPGGTVYKVKDYYFSNKSAYVQVAPGVGQAQIFFGNELSYSEYLPSSARNYSFIPLEAVVNKVTEDLFTDRRLAEYADGTKPPEKMLIVTESNPYGSLDGDLTQDIPLNKSEQKRIEQKVNQPMKNSIMTFSGNHVEVVDLGRENTMALQSERQRVNIRESVAIVYNATNLEMNLTGSESTSGRSTSEAQMEIEQGKGISPIAQNIESTLTRDILPYAFGTGYIFEFEKSKNEKEEKELDIIMLQTGELTSNELREKYNKTTFSGEEFDKPKDTTLETGQSELAPMFTKGVE